MLELSNGESNFEELMRISFNNSSWHDLGPRKAFKKAFRKEMKVKVKSLSHVRHFAIPWTLRNGIFQARILEWAVISFCRGSS